jgi:hypothetical protein
MSDGGVVGGEEYSASLLKAAPIPAIHLKSFPTQPHILRHSPNSNMTRMTARVKIGERLHHRF